MPPLSVDFVSGAIAHRRHYGGGKGQMIAKAIGIKPGVYPSVLDATAGLGKDAFVLASLGCTVTLLERHPVVFQALQEGFLCAQAHAQAHDIELMNILDRMIMFNVDARDYLRDASVLEQQVIYLDPMFPERQKSAAVKKDMVYLQALVGEDDDSSELFASALASSAYRVVVKRPKLAPPLREQLAPVVFRGSSSRFDVYPRKTLTKLTS